MGLAIFCGIILFIAILIGNANSKKKKALWNVYQQAIASGNKRNALDAGRAYYSKLRGGKLTIYDEQALTNDLSTMS